VYDLPDVDVLGGTYYMSDATASLGAALTMVGGRKAVIVKEFGVVGDASFASVGRVLSGLEYWSGDPELGLGGLLSGALLWSLRGHAAGGGFYWHYEVSSNGTFPASLHWPGFSSGARDGVFPSDCHARSRAPLGARGNRGRRRSGGQGNRPLHLSMFSRSPMPDCADTESPSDSRPEDLRLSLTSASACLFAC
jgi:hypothetical protein